MIFGERPFGFFASVGLKQDYNFYGDGVNRRYLAFAQEPRPTRDFNDARAVGKAVWAWTG